ncbi:gamma-aminobutyric acid type B receptor subunit 2 [Cylas formicarius]|uniref:gamma-aminobutyric acid type B receptor subunit 2 n=1 Tax=Cylas formicarius TaxID=197179 RepID=UPI00295872F0|nr:gamma-aminobutyric acid type B receptor subunit 2 [Cylas formicarius]
MTAFRADSRLTVDLLCWEVKWDYVAPCQDQACNKVRVSENQVPRESTKDAVNEWGEDVESWVHIDNESNLAFSDRTTTFRVRDALKTFNASNVVVDELNFDREVYILGLFDLTGGRGTSEELVAAEMAVKHVNRLSLVPGYKIILLVNDTKCDPGVAVDRLFHALYSDKTILMLLGAGCSNVSETLAHVVPYWNILQVSYGSTSPSLSDRLKFPLFFRTALPDSSHNLAKIHLIKAFAWQVVITFTETESAYLFPINHFVVDLERENVTAVFTVSFSAENYKDQLKVLKNTDIRIIIGSFSSEMAPKVFCAAHDLDMRGDEYVWILHEHHTKWWTSDGECAHLRIATEGVILSSSRESLEDENTVPEEAGEVPMYGKWARQAYDAVWAMALIMASSRVDSLDKFGYHRKDMACDFMESMRNLAFVGLSGPVRFKGADRIGDLVLRQIRDGKPIPIAFYDSIADRLNFNCPFCVPISWKNKPVPIARRILKLRTITIPKALYCFVSGLAFLGVCLSAAFLYFNLRFRRLKYVKLSSPKLNVLAAVGCICVYVSVILSRLSDVLPEAEPFFDATCSIRTYLLSAGFSLTFGSIFAKSYRVHRLFTDANVVLLRGKFLRDNQLIALISIALIADAAVMFLWLEMDPLHRHLHSLPMESSSVNRGVVYEPQVALCQCRNTVGWHVALFGYKGIVLLMSVYVAWKTRHVKIQALNDSQYIGICVYSAVFCALLVVLFDIVDDYVVVSYAVRNLSILSSSTVTLFLLILPKFKSVSDKRDAEEGIMQAMGLKIQSNTRRFIAEDPTEIVWRLEIQNKVHKSRLESLEKEMARLEALLNPSFTTASADVHLLSSSHQVNVRASWPTTQGHSLKPFSSEQKLVGEKVSEKLNFVGKLRRIVGSFNSL